MTTIESKLCALTHLGIIRASGTDAVSFLQGQLSNDFVLLADHQPQLAAYCSAKGRMLASFIGIKRTTDGNTSEVLLICRRDILSQTLKRLSMFVLRAKVTLSDATQELPLYGELPAKTYVIAPDWAKLQTYGTLMPLSHWLWEEVQSGIAHIGAHTVDMFVPQMLNYESVLGISFKKGCYPGQEVVARSQFRGAIKRRTFLAKAVRLQTLPLEGSDVLDANQEVCGVWVQGAKRDNPSEIHGLLCLQNSELAMHVLMDGVAYDIQLLDLPYPLLTDI